MFKFLRKYNKWILAIGGGLLMIVFLLGETLPRMTAGAGAAAATRATVGPDGRERIPARLWAQYDIEAGFIRNAEMRGQSSIPFRLEGTEHWLLLVREAKLAGLVSEPGSIAVNEDLLLGLSQQGIRADDFRRFAAHEEGVRRLFALYLQGSESSDHRLRNFASRIFHKVDAEVLVIPAADDRKDIQPSEEQLAAHLERFKDYEPGEGPMGLGYKLPDRVKLEWITISAADVRDAIAASEEMDGVSLRVHWQRNPRGTFPPFDREARAVPFEVREDLLDQLTNERLERVVTYINAQLSTARRGLDQRDGYFVLPENWEEQRLPLPQLAQNIQQQRDVPLPSYHAPGEWLRVSDLDTLEEIGMATTDRFGAERRLRELVAAAKEFGGSGTVIMQSGVAGPPLRDDFANIYVVRILDADPSRSPRTVDEVRDELIADFRRIAAYEELVERASEFEQLAIERGMLAMALEHEAELATRRISLASVELARLFMQVGQAPRLMPTSLPVIGQHRETIDTIIDHALALPANAAMSEIPVEQRTLVLPVEDHLALVIVRITGQEPLTREMFVQVAAENLPQRIMFAEELEGIEHLEEAFSLDTLAKKHNLRVIRGREEEDDEVEVVSLGG